MDNNQEQIQKLNAYSESINPSGQQIPAVIPSLKQNVKFDYTDLAPKYVAGTNIQIDNHIISKTDTTYSGDNNVIFVDNDTKTISAVDVDTNRYVADGTTVENKTPDSDIYTFGLKNISIESTLPNNMAKQPSYRAADETKFAGISNFNYILDDKIFEEDNTKYTGFTRFYGGSNPFVRCTDATDVTNYKDIEIKNLAQINQISIHQHKLNNLYFDFNFFKDHLGKEIYITRTYSAEYDSYSNYNGCKFFITESVDSQRRLRVYISTCGMLCFGETNYNNSTGSGSKEICLHDISYNEWSNGFTNENFNYILKPWEFKTGYTGNIIENSEEMFWYDEDNNPNYKYYITYPNIISATVVSYYNKFYKTNDPRSYWKDFNAYEVIAECMPYYWNPTVNAWQPTGQTEIRKVHRATKPGQIYNYYPYSKNEYFGSFKFIVATIGEEVIDNEIYDVLYLVDSRF